VDVRANVEDADLERRLGIGLAQEGGDGRASSERAKARPPAVSMA